MANQKLKHPIQPLYKDLDAGPLPNALARMPFSDEDREQFAQLIGYST